MLVTHGSYFVGQISNEYGNNDIFADSLFYDPYSTVADSRNDSYEGLFPFTPENPLNYSPWDFWAWDNVNATVPADSVSARLYIDTIMQYYIPRACLALGLDCDLSQFFTSTGVLLPPDAVGLNILPNPATDFTKIEAAGAFPMQHIYVYD